MHRVPIFIALWLVACSAGQDAGALHHPDLSLSQLGSTAEGSSALFTNYRPDGPSSWNQEWPWKLDLTGIAWDRSNTATVITPRHVVMASHYIRKVGQEVVYHDRQGRRHARTMQKVVHFRERGYVGDVAVGLLDRPLPGSIRQYPLPEPRADEGAALIGAVALVTEQKRNLYFHQISRVGSYGLGFRFDDRIPENREKRLTSGDSGHPSFLLSKGELVLIETHTGGGSGSGPYYGSKQVIDGLRAITKELDPQYSFRTVSIDSRTLKGAEVGGKQLPKPQPKPQVRTQPTRPSQPSPSAAPRKPRPRVVVPPTPRPADARLLPLPRWRE